MIQCCLPRGQGIVFPLPPRWAVDVVVVVVVVAVAAVAAVAAAAAAVVAVVAVVAAAVEAPVIYSYISYTFMAKKGAAKEA